MSQNGPSVALHALGLCAALLGLVATTRSARISSRVLDVSIINTAFRDWPLAELLVVLAAIPSLSWALLLSFTMGAALSSNMLVSSATSIAGITRIGGGATGPLFIAACLCFVPIVFGIWAASSKGDMKFLVGCVTISTFLLITYAITLPVLYVMSRGETQSEEPAASQDSLVNTSTGDALARVEEETSKDSLHKATEKSGTPALEAQEDDLNAAKSETSPLLGGNHPNPPQANSMWRQGTILASSVLAMLCFSIATAYCIQGIGGHNEVLEAAPAFIAGLIVAGSRALPAAHRLLLQPLRADFIAAQKLCTSGLLLLVIGLFAHFLEALVESYSWPLWPVWPCLLLIPVEATVLAAIGLWTDSLVYVYGFGLPALSFTSLPLLIFLFAITSHVSMATTLAELQASILLT